MLLRSSILKTKLDSRFLGSIVQTSRQHTRAYSVVPRVATPSFWQSLIPKPFRHTQQPTASVPLQRTSIPKPWNPATFFIVIFLVIGSNSINLLALKKDALSFSRQADARIATLREAIEKVQRGEDVDVKRLLGTGDPVAEQEWEEVLKELKQERPLSESKRNKKITHTENESHIDSTQKSASEKAEAWERLRGNSQKPGKVEFY